jgi:hypothetical protein
MKEPFQKDWVRFVKEGLCYDGITNVSGDFSKLSKKFGLSYMYYLEIAFKSKDELTNEEFCQLNGSVPLRFLDKFMLV